MSKSNRQTDLFDHFRLSSVTQKKENLESNNKKLDFVVYLPLALKQTKSLSLYDYIRCGKGCSKFFHRNSQLVDMVK